jgi:aminoglycoside/choline kinase family phosphotransferase
MNTLPEPLTAWVSQWLSKSRLSSLLSAETLAGDGSNRCFYRIHTSNKDFVLLSDPEWTLSKDYPAHQNYLKEKGVPVPEFFEVDSKLGCLLMEDLGDTLLQQEILNHPDQKLRELENATALLAELHGRTFPVPEDLPASTRKFDREKYSQELFFTLEHLHSKLFKLPSLSDSETKNVMVFCENLEKTFPVVFCHRDYHTRNILVRNGKLVLIEPTQPRC